MSATLEARLQWLLDRTAISDLLHSFARSLDTRDYPAYVDNFAPGGAVELPDPMRPGGTIVLRRDEMLEQLPRSIGRYAATHHLSANHQIDIDADSARSRSYLQAVHVRGPDPADHWSAGGWYDCDYVRLPAGWKFQRVRLCAVWLSGAPGPIRPD